MIIKEFCEGHEVLVAPTSSNNLVLVTIPKSFGIDDFITLISKHDLPDNPVYGVRFGNEEEVRVIR
jgi:hypothetical protein